MGISSAMAPLSNSSSAQDAGQCFTPTSTLTSQGSAYSSSTQRTPTRGSPQHASPFARGCGMAGGGSGGGDEHLEYSESTLQRQQVKPQVVTGSTSVRHNVKVIGMASSNAGCSAMGHSPARNDDSANFSLPSSNGSHSANDYATSVVWQSRFRPIPLLFLMYSP